MTQVGAQLQFGLVTAGQVAGGCHGVMMVTESPSTFFTTAMRLGNVCSTSSVYDQLTQLAGSGPTWASSTPAGKAK